MTLAYKFSIRVLSYVYLATWKTLKSTSSPGNLLVSRVVKPNFLIDHNMINWMKTNIRMFSDDTKNWTYYAAKPQEDLDIHVKWWAKWLLKFNPLKCKLMHLRHGHEISHHPRRSEMNNRACTTGKRLRSVDFWFIHVLLVHGSCVQGEPCFGFENAWWRDSLRYWTKRVFSLSTTALSDLTWNMLYKLGLLTCPGISSFLSTARKKFKEAQPRWWGWVCRV